MTWKLKTGNCKHFPPYPHFFNLDLSNRATAFTYLLKSKLTELFHTLNTLCLHFLQSPQKYHIYVQTLWPLEQSLKNLESQRQCTSAKTKTKSQSSKTVQNRNQRTPKSENRNSALAKAPKTLKRSRTTLSGAFSIII